MEITAWLLWLVCQICPHSRGQPQHMLHRGTLNNSCWGMEPRGVGWRGAWLPQAPPASGLRGSNVVERQPRNGAPALRRWARRLLPHWRRRSCGSPRWAGEGFHGRGVPVPRGQAALSAFACCELCACSWECSWPALLDVCWASLPMVMPVLVRLWRDPPWDSHR